MPTLRSTVAVLGATFSLTAAALVGVVASTPSHATAAPTTAAPIPYKVPATSDPQAVLRPGEQLIRGGDRTVLAGATLPPGTRRSATTLTPFILELRADGNLVEYRDDPAGETVVWSTGGGRASRLVFQSDRNVVLLDAANRPLWSTGTAGTSADRFSVYGNGQLMVQDAAGRVYAAIGPSTTASPGVIVSSATSPSGEFVLIPQGDGNLVEYQRVGRGVRAVWSTRTVGAGAVRLAAQLDGNLVLYQLSTGRAVWNSRTQGATGYHQLDVQDDANVVLYRTDGTRRVQALWASNTRV